MPIYKNGYLIKKMFKGDTEIKKAYKDNSVVFTSEVAPVFTSATLDKTSYTQDTTAVVTINFTNLDNYAIKSVVINGQTIAVTGTTAVTANVTVPHETGSSQLIATISSFTYNDGISDKTVAITPTYELRAEVIAIQPTLTSANADKSWYYTSDNANITVTFTNPSNVPITSVRIDGVDYATSGTTSVVVTVAVPDTVGTNMHIATIQGFTYTDYQARFVDSGDIEIRKDVISTNVIPIFNATDLQGINNHGSKADPSKEFWVMNDITWSGDFTPITGFGSNFNGNNYQIHNFYSTRGSLIANTTSSGVVKNARMTSVNINTANNNVGSFVGENYGNVKNCSSSGTIKGGQYVGGIVGRNRAIIRNCFSTANMSGWVTGGIVGQCETNATVESCYANGSVATVSNQNYPQGGLVGQFYGPGRVAYCYATGNISGQDAVGGFLGYYQYTADMQIINCYCTGNVSGLTKVYGFCGTSKYNMLSTNWSYEKQIVDGVPIHSNNDGYVNQMATLGQMNDNGWQSNVLGGQWLFNSGYYPKLKNSDTGQELPYQNWTPVRAS